MKRMTKAILCFLLILNLSVSVKAAGAVPEKVINATESVVRILAKYSDGYATGTGFVIKSDKNETLIVTNHHVVEDNPYSISVWADNEELINAEILVATNQKDICILRLTQQISLKPVSLSETSAKQGDAVYAVGFPGAADILSDTDAHTSQDATITDGIVSARREVTTTQYGTAVEILQISAAINSGNSGGPLFDLNGKVVGVNTYGIADAQGIFGAIDISEIHRFLGENGIVLKPSSNMITPTVILAGLALLAAGCITIFSRKKKVSRGMNKKKSSTTLRNFMAAYPDGLGIHDAVALLLPVALQLRDMHNNGQPHLQVSPDTIMVSTTAQLAAPTEAESNRYTSGFAAKEIYSGSSKGILSDIYSFCAVLYYVSFGIVPINALQRNSEDICEDENTAFAQIINQGMQMQPEDRFDTMQSVILKLSEYNVKLFVPKEEIPKNKSTTPRAKGISSKGKIIIAISAIVVVIVVGYLSSYLAALHFAKNGNYSFAGDCLLVPSITELHDKQLPVYIDAGILMDQRQYMNAKALYESIPGFLNSDVMVLEADYSYAAQLADANDFRGALSKYASLADENYKDSKAKEKEVRYRRYLYLMYEEQDYLTAYNYLIASQYDDMNNISDIRNELKELLYNEAVNYYLDGQYDQADTRFVKGFKESDKYLLLIKARKNINFSDKEVKKLIDMFYFEDTAEILLSKPKLALVFLRGTWKGDGYFFTIDENHSCSNNLPKAIFDEYHAYNIDDGNYVVTSIADRNQTYKQFHITAIAPDCIQVFCYSNNQTYILHKQ